MMEATRAMRASGAAGLLASVLILGGLYLFTAGMPGRDADAGAWAAWARQGERAVEAGTYYLLVPGLLLFLWMFAALASLMPAGSIPARLAGYGAVSFFVLFAAGAVLGSTTPSTFGFYSGFDDPNAVTVLMGVTAGYHLQAVGIWSLALTMVATATGLRSSPAIPSWMYLASIALAMLTVAASQLGFGIVFCLLWIVSVGIWLLRRTPARGDTRDN